MECRQGGEIETRGEEVKVDGKEAGLWRRTWNWDGGRTVWSRKGVSYSIFCTRNMDDIAGELRDISQITLLSGGPR